ncbi:MAG: ATP-binding protein [Roseovarius sp.]|nr:ATP-binding protein [Roseovarius sp.]
MTRFETLTLLTCASRVAQTFSYRTKPANELSEWLERHPLGFDWSPETVPFAPTQVSRQDWNDLQDKLAREIARVRKARPDAMARNCADLAHYLGLNRVEADICMLSARAAQGGPLGALVDNLVDDARLPLDQAIACLTARPASAIRKAMSVTGKLMNSGLISREGGRHNNHGLSPNSRLSRALEPPTRGLQDILHGLFTTPAAPETTWQDFDHLGEARDFAERLLKGALGRKAAGVNILLYGPPGTGKTEFCKVIAAHLDAQLFAVGETDDDGDEPSRSERQMQLRLGQRLLAGRRDALVLFDEMEDLLAQPDLGFLFGINRRGGSKVHLHRLLETNPVPTLWTTNSIDRVDPALLRRVTFALELRQPPQHVRARIWARLSDKHRMKLDPATQNQLARESSDAPALADTALRAAKLAGGREADLHLTLRASAKAVRGGREPAPVAQAEATFDPRLAHADIDLNTILERLTAKEAPRAVSLCLSGPPGTGKSAYARHLAEAMGLPVVQKRASDLMGMYVGQTEARIARAFAQARQEEAFLIFDEADSLLSNREGAQRSWEVSQVNEMLTWMESHPQPFACTTNMADRLDPAALRRFSFRATFLPLTALQRMAAFRQFFGQEPPKDLQSLDLLTPGDFAVVAKRARLLDIRRPVDLLAELAREQAAKPGARAPVGFRNA